MITNQYKKIKPLVIGIGVAGKRHLEAQLSLGIKTGIYTTNPQTAESLREQNNVIVFDNLEDGLDWSSLVHVCTPDDKHTEFVAKALEKKKNVLCEKAFTTNLKDALYLQNLAHKNNTTLIIGQNYRLTPSFAETKEIISEGKLGKVIRIKATYFHDKADYQKRYSNQSFLYTGGTHAVDLACWIAGEEAVNVKAKSKNQLNYQITLKFSSGIKGDIELDASVPCLVSGTDLIVEGEKGKLVGHNKSDKLLFYEKGNPEPELTLVHNTTTYTIPLEIKIIDEYLSGNARSYWPLPDADEAINAISILDTVKKTVS